MEDDRNTAARVYSEWFDADNTYSATRADRGW